MPIVNCRRCGRIFNRVRRDICQNCITEETKEFELVRAYLRDHRDASLGDVVEATGVELEAIVAMIQDGRLMLHDNPNLVYECERCGGPTQSGRMCGTCTKELADGLSGAATAVRQRLNQQQANKRDGGYRSR